ncbi:polysaccharide biosynthesis protein [Streptomyces sp. TRM66268-LWL]|uniref:Polysaccharide biosynthesis protein n=1 Tax=Streptomyces polyasparticus TaxID=2767826 RepID=A0ABR7SSZ0_9ACTN|nr:Wzz/FepE/Etk N-terminal domain-containing protein [Streptomyces polyasparticus]MBC9717413.1 polysaccharide biosynthesis protein [Streptomyces polyasparticus]
MSTNVTPDAPHATPLLDLQALVVAVRRRRRFWCIVALLGLLAGAAVAVFLPPPPTAVSTVLVAHEADQPNDPGTLIRTDAALLKTTRIAGQALKSLGSAERPEDFMQDFEGTGLTNNLLQITVKGDSDADAVARAKALSEAFVADHVRRLQEAAEAEAKALLVQRDQMRDDLAEVNAEIGDGTPEADPETGPGASANLESLFARRAELTSRIADFDQRAEEARMGAPRLIAGTQIVDAARAVEHSLRKSAATNAGIGLVLGLVLGLALAAVGSVVADRPLLRRAIAADLGASVLAELPRRRPVLWRRHRDRVARERLTVSLARTVRGSAEPLSLLELGCARPTSTIALDLAAELAGERPVAVLDGLPGRQLAGRQPKTDAVRVVSGADAVPHELPLGVGSLAPGTAWTDLQYLGTRTVLVVRAGHARAAWLHTVARQLADQRIEVLGVVLIDPDPRDRTDGTLWDGRQTALRGQSERLARLNGTARPHKEPLPVPAARAADSDEEGR